MGKVIQLETKKNIDNNNTSTPYDVLPSIEIDAVISEAVIRIPVGHKAKVFIEKVTNEYSSYQKLNTSKDIIMPETDTWFAESNGFTSNPDYGTMQLRIGELITENEQLHQQIDLNRQIIVKLSDMVENFESKENKAREVTEFMKKQKCFVIPKLHIRMLLTSAFAVAIAVSNLLQLAITNQSFISPYIALALLCLGLGWGGSVLITVKKMGVQK